MKDKQTGQAIGQAAGQEKSHVSSGKNVTNEHLDRDKVIEIMDKTLVIAGNRKAGAVWIDSNSKRKAAELICSLHTMKQQGGAQERFEKALDWLDLENIENENLSDLVQTSLRNLKESHRIAAGLTIKDK